MGLCSYCETLQSDLIGKWGRVAAEGPDEPNDEEPEHVDASSCDVDEDGESEHVLEDRIHDEREAEHEDSEFEPGSTDSDPIVGDFDSFGRRIFSALRRDSACCHLCSHVLQIFTGWAVKEAALQDNQSLDIRISYNLTFEGQSNTSEPDLLLYNAGTVSFNILNPRKDGYVWGPTIAFHNLRHDSFSVTELLDMCPGVSWPDEGRICARIRPEIADVRLFKKWSDWCTQFNADTCRPGLQGDRLSMLRVIDVEQKCVTDMEVTADSRCVALSYVWGGARDHVLTSLNKNRLYQVGVLNEAYLPATIYDAMLVAQGMKERFLWVDALCILQDDVKDKSIFIGRMDDIYAQAAFTIINTAGADARDLLPGVREQSVRETQPPLDFKGSVLVRRLDPMDSQGSPAWLGDSVWSTRGWTLQE